MHKRLVIKHCGRSNIIPKAKCKLSKVNHDPSSLQSRLISHVDTQPAPHHARLSAAELHCKPRVLSIVICNIAAVFITLSTAIITVENDFIVAATFQSGSRLPLLQDRNVGSGESYSESHYSDPTDEDNYSVMSGVSAAAKSLAGVSLSSAPAGLQASASSRTL